MTLGFVKLSRFGNATIEVTVADIFRQKPENVCGNAQVLWIRTKLINGNIEGTEVLCFLTDIAREKVSSIVTAWLTPSLMLLMTSSFGTNGKREIVKKCGPLTQLLSCKASADIPRVPAPAELSLVASWFHWSTLIFSRISKTRFVTKIGCFS